MNPLLLKDIMEADSREGKRSGKTTNHDAIAMVMHHFHPVPEHGLPPSLNLNHNVYSIFPRIHVGRESMARGT